MGRPARSGDISGRMEGGRGMARPESGQPGLHALNSPDKHEGRDYRPARCHSRHGFSILNFWIDNEPNMSKLKGMKAAAKPASTARPRPNRDAFESVVKKLLASPPVPMVEVQRRRKGQKKLAKVLGR